MIFPRMFRIKQALEGPVIFDVLRTIHDNLQSLNLQHQVKNGQAVAITAGSRGITGIAKILKSIVGECKSLGLKPFIIPAMGSHGGATADGQKHLLEHYDITAESMDCEIKSSMEVVQIGVVKGIPVYCDRNAWEADHIVVVARVKPHTDFDNEIESGLFKMMDIGLGKQKGAEIYHRAGQHYSYAEIFPAVGKTVLETGKILFGVAIVENGYGDTAKAEVISPKDFYDKGKNLLRDAKSWLGRLPFDNLDLLIVDEMGKNISGAGMDPNDIGRQCIQKHPESPKIHHLFVRDITMESDGNATGIGMADLTTKRLVEKINRTVTNMNVVTSAALDVTKIPVWFDSDRDALKTALGMIGLTAPEDARVVRIKNTLHLTEMLVSEPLREEVTMNNSLSVLALPEEMQFDVDGDLLPF